MIVVAEKKINKISLCCKTIEIQISSFAGFASIRQTPTELPRQAGEWRMLFEVLPSTLTKGIHVKFDFEDSASSFKFGLVMAEAHPPPK